MVANPENRLIGPLRMVSRSSPYQSKFVDELYLDTTNICKASANVNFLYFFFQNLLYMNWCAYLKSIFSTIFGRERSIIKAKTFV